MKRLLAFLFSGVFVLAAFSQDSFIDLYSYGHDLIKAHEYSMAIENLEKAYEVATAKSQERSRALWAKGMALYMMAQNMRMDKDYEGAYMKYAEAMVCFQRVNRDEDVVGCICSMALLNANHFGYRDLALEQYEYAFNIAQELNLAEIQTEILMEIIAIHKYLHNEYEANSYNIRLDSVISANHSLVANPNLFLNKGHNAFQNEDWDIAVSYYKRFLETNPKDDSRFAALQGLRDTYDKLGDYETALAYSNECVDDWKRAFANNASQKYLIYKNHFPFQIKVGDFNGALASIDSLQKSTSVTDTDFAYGELLMERARVFSQLQKWDDAIRDYHSADSLMSITAPTVAVKDKLESLVPLYAGALYRNGNLQESYQLYIRYLDMMKNSYGEKSMEYVNALYYLANIEGFVNKLNDGTRHYIKSWRTAKDIAEQDLQFLPANARGKYWNEIKDLMWNMIPYGIAANCQEDDFTSSAFEALMFSKGLLLSAEESIGEQVQDCGDEKLLTDFLEVANLRNDIERLKADRMGYEVMNVYTRMDSLDRVLSLKLSNQNIHPIVSAPSTSEVAKILKKNSVLIDFADYVKNNGTHVYAAFILRKGMNSPRLINVFDQSSLYALITKNKGKYSSLYEDYNSQELYDIVLKRLMDEIKGCQTIFFIPSGILNQIAIEAIKLPDGGIMGEKYDIVRLTNSRELLTYNDNNRIRDFETAWLYGGLEYDVDTETMTKSAKEYEVSPLLATRGGTSRLKATKGFKKLRMSEYELIEINKRDLYT